MESLKIMDYANLDNEQEGKLRQLEKSFNEEFGTEFYLLAMKKD